MYVTTEKELMLYMSRTLSLLNNGALFARQSAFVGTEAALCTFAKGKYSYKVTAVGGRPRNITVFQVGMIWMIDKSELLQ